VLIVNIWQDNFVLYPAVFGAYTELFCILTPELTPNNSGAYVYPWGRLGSIPKGVEASMKPRSAGGTGLADKFLAWCGRQTEVFM
jgi:retinol dehydrogenase 12